MTRLLRKNVPFECTDEHEKSFQYIRNQLLTGKLYLAAQDQDRPLIQETDGSDDGWGVILLQEVDGKRKALHMKRAPPYYKETAAWMNGMKRIPIYEDYYPFPVECVTEHIPLTYVENTSGKGPVSQFVLDNLRTRNYNIPSEKGTN